ncbi:MAG: pirin family protein [Mesorhizobium sp.]|jgi:redox-sensitive bicupin YhaK (pirin superfamily)
MSFFPARDPEPGDVLSCDAIELMLVARAKDIGGFEVRRALPTARRRLVGPFIFFDRMGPAILRPGQAFDVRPHPHIGLATVTYLFDGFVRHRDSLGTEMVIEPGDVNLMTAGRGIVHSERSPEEMRGNPLSISGLQTWLALPDGKEEIPPVFEHTLRSELPEIQSEGISGRIVIGAFDGVRSPVVTQSDTLYADIRLAAGASVRIPADAEERAIYVLDGMVTILGDRFRPNVLLVFRPGDEIVVSSEQGAHFMLFGGASLGSNRYIWWNFVSSSKERIEQAKEEWKTGRFDIVPGDEEEFIPLPEN